MYMLGNISNNVNMKVKFLGVFIIIVYYLSLGIFAVIYPKFLTLVIIAAVISGVIWVGYLALGLKYWEILFLLLWASGLVFRFRGVRDIEIQVIDVWAFYRIILVVLVGSILMVIALRINVLRTMFCSPLRYFFLLALWQIVSVLWSMFPAWSLYRAVEYTINVFLIAFITVKLKDFNLWRRFLNFIWIIVLILLLNIWFQSLVFPEKALEHTKGIIGFRIGSFVPHIGGNGSGELGALITLIGFARIINGSKKIGNFILVILGIVTVIFSESRSPFLGLVIGILLILFVSRKIINVKSLVFILCCILFLIGPFWDMFSAWFLRGQPKNVFYSLTGRLDYWQATLELITSKNKLFTGFGAYTCRFYIFKYLGTEISHLHNAYIEIFAGGGIVGLLLFVLGVLYTFYFIIFKLRSKFYTISNNNDKMVISEMVGAFGLWSVRSIFSSSIFIWHPAVLYLTIIGFITFLNYTYFPSQSLSTSKNV